MVSHNLQQRGAVEAVDLQEVRNWPGGQGVSSGYELYTDIDLDTAVAIPRDFACDVREKVLSKRYTFGVVFGTVWGFVHLPCHGDVSVVDAERDGGCCYQSSPSSSHLQLDVI